MNREGCPWCRSSYKHIYDETKKQTKKTIRVIFPKKVTFLQEEPQAGPVGGVPEEGPVVTGGGSSVHVLLLLPLKTF